MCFVLLYNTDMYKILFSAYAVIAVLLLVGHFVLTGLGKAYGSASGGVVPLTPYVCSFVLILIAYVVSITKIGHPSIIVHIVYISIIVASLILPGIVFNSYTNRQRVEALEKAYSEDISYMRNVIDGGEHATSQKMYKLAIRNVRPSDEFAHLYEQILESKNVDMYEEFDTESVQGKQSLCTYSQNISYPNKLLDVFKKHCTKSE